MNRWKRQMRRLVLLLAALVLAGCGLPAAVEPVAPRGGYVEAEITPSRPNGDPVGLFARVGGQVDYFLSLSSGTLKHFHSADSGESWQERDTSWLKQAVSQCGVRAGETMVIVGMQGEIIYCALWDLDGLLRLFRVNASGGVEDVSIPEWRSGAMTSPYRGIHTLYVGPDGSVGIDYFFGAGPAILYRPGKEAAQAWLSGWDAKQAAAFTEQAIAILTDEGELRLFNAQTGELAKSLTPPHRTGQMALAADVHDALYVAAEGTVDRLAAGGALFETVLEGKQFAIAKPDTRVLRLCYEADADTFYILTEMDDGPPRLYRYVYDAALLLEP